MTVYSGTEGVDLCRIERAMYRNIILVSVIAVCWYDDSFQYFVEKIVALSKY
jgi:hypothetical protein